MIFFSRNTIFNPKIKLHAYLQGLSDEIHTVVKQSLISLEKILSTLLDHRSSWFYEGNICLQPIVTCTEDLPIAFDIPNTISLLEEILDKLSLVFENKYWVIQNKYCQFVASINYDALDDVFGRDKGQVYKVIKNCLNYQFEQQLSNFHFLC